MFAILRASEEDIDQVAASRALAPGLHKNPTDLMRQFRNAPGILLEGLGEADVRFCLGVFEKLNVPVTAVPETRVVQSLVVAVLRSCELSAEALRYDYKNTSYSVPWDDVRWIDMADVGKEERHSGENAADQVAGVESYHTPEGTSFRTPEYSGLGAAPQRSMVTRWRPRIDLVVGRMESLLRIDVKQFDFHSTGQKVHASRRQNAWSLCIGLVTRASKAAKGPGVRWVTDGGVPERQRVRSDAVYDNLLRWRLTLLNTTLDAMAADAFSTKRDLQGEESPEQQSQRFAELVSLGKAILEDGEISLDEVKRLCRWLRENRNLKLPTVRFLSDVMGRITADKVITSAERRELKRAIYRILPPDE